MLIYFIYYINGVFNVFISNAYAQGAGLGGDGNLMSFYLWF